MFAVCRKAVLQSTAKSRRGSGSALRGLPLRPSSPQPAKCKFAPQFAFLCIFIHIGYIGHRQIFASIVRPKKTRTTSMHFRRFLTYITAPTSWSNIFSMHSLLICGFLIFTSSLFFFGSKEVVVASGSLPSIALRSARMSINFISINKLMYSPSKNQNEHPYSYTHDDVPNEQT